MPNPTKRFIAGLSETNEVVDLLTGDIFVFTGSSGRVKLTDRKWGSAQERQDAMDGIIADDAVHPDLLPLFAGKDNIGCAVILEFDGEYGMFEY